MNIFLNIYIYNYVYIYYVTLDSDLSQCPIDCSWVALAAMEGRPSVPANLSARAAATILLLGGPPILRLGCRIHTTLQAFHHRSSWDDMTINILA